MRATLSQVPAFGVKALNISYKAVGEVAHRVGDAAAALDARPGATPARSAGLSAPQESGSRVESRGPAVVLVVAAVTILAAAEGALWIRWSSQWPTLILVAGFVALLESRGPVVIPLGRSRINFSAKAYASIGAVYLLGPAAAVASMLGSSLASASARRTDPVKMLFNASMTILVLLGTYRVFDVLETRAHGSVEFLIVGSAIGGCAGWLINHFLLGTVLSAEQGWSNFNKRAYVRGVVLLLPYYIGYGLTGLGVVAASGAIGGAAALITLAAPVAIVQIATNRWIREQGARVEEARSGFNATLISLSKAIDLRDKDTEGHCRRVVEYSLLIGRNLKFNSDELVRLCHGALLHDIGKIGVPDAILMKPGALTDEEWAVMRTHPRLGFEMVADVRQLERAREIILNHHERYDGKGYPQGLAGDAIPLPARVFTIADAFDAMISDRPYRRGMSLQAAREEVRRCAGTQFDPICVEAFDKISDHDLVDITKEREHPTEDLLSLFD